MTVYWSETIRMDFGVLSDFINRSESFKDIAQGPSATPKMLAAIQTIKDAGIPEDNPAFWRIVYANYTQETVYIHYQDGTIKTIQ